MVWYLRLNNNRDSNAMDPNEDISSTNQATRQMLPRAQTGAIRSHDLLKGAREIRIAHGEEVYRLSVTRQGKLILTK